MSGGPRLPYARLQLLSLLALALVPLLIFSLVIGGRLYMLVNSDADQATERTLDAVAAVVQERQQQLSDATKSYATWDAFRTSAAAMDREWLKTEVFDFVIAQGVADAALLRVGDQRASSGDDSLVAAVSAQIDESWAGQPLAVMFGRPDGVYELAMWPVDVPGATASTPAVLAFAKRLDERFVSQAKAMTGWDVAVAGTDGSISVASRLEPFDKLGTPDGGSGSGGVASSHWTRQSNGQTGGSRPLGGADGQPVGAIMVATDLGALGDIPQQLLQLLGLLLVPTIVGALLISLLLSIRIRSRLQVLERGVAAVAAGDLSVRLPTRDRDGFERLASSHNRLAAALERRDRTLAKLLDAVASLYPHEGVAGVAQGGVAAARDIFGLGWCALRSVDGAMIAADPPAGGSDPVGDIEIAHGDEAWRFVWGGTPEGWSAADADLLELYANQLASTLRDAESYERAANRARSLRRSYRLQADFLRGVSHNLQSPLSAIVGLSDDLRNESRLTYGARRRVDVINGQAHRLSRLVKQLLTMSRLEAGTLEVEAELCSVEPIVRRAWRAQNSDREFELRNEAFGALAVADPQALEQVLWILLDNAIRYAPNGPIRVHVSVAARPVHRRAANPPGGAVAAAQSARPARGEPEGELHIRVQDEGPGVPAAEQRAIFRRFQRGSTSAGQEGTGLGLDVARGLLRAMNGRITYEPGPVGATFVVTIPAEVSVAPS
jgi:signal transduction histidine kinase/HAMP domain-containing protein